MCGRAFLGSVNGWRNYKYDNLPVEVDDGYTPAWNLIVAGFLGIFHSERRWGGYAHEGMDRVYGRDVYTLI